MSSCDSRVRTICSIDGICASILPICMHMKDDRVESAVFAKSTRIHVKQEG